MKKRAFLAAAFGLLLSACASGPPPAPPAPPTPPPLDPTGTYDIVVSAQGMEISGVMTIRGSVEEGYTGDLDTEMGGASVTSIVVDGQTMTFSIPEGGMSGEVVFDGDAFIGTMAGGMGDADFQGIERTGG